MRLNEQSNTIGFVSKVEEIHEIGHEATSLLRDNTVTYGYRELPQIDGGRLDVLEQLKANIQHIEELSGKLSFILKEVQSIIKKA